MGNLHLELPNGSNQTKMISKNTIHAPNLAFTLISISRLDRAGYSATFCKGMCTIENPNSWTVTTIPHSDGLYKIAALKPSSKLETVNTVSGKMSISEAHRKLGHLAYSTVKFAITKGFITGIELDNDSEPKLCEAYAKAKSAQQPFPRESKMRATKFGECIHWDLWGPAAVKSLNGHSYVAAHIDDASQETKLYFQANKSQTFESYKEDEAHIEMQTGNRIKCMRSDQGCYKLFFFFYTCLPCSSLLFFIYDWHAFTSRQTCLLHMSTSFLHYALHMFTSRLTHSLYLFKPVVRQLYSLAFH